MILAAAFTGKFAAVFCAVARALFNLYPTPSLPADAYIPAVIDPNALPSQSALYAS